MSRVSGCYSIYSGHFWCWSFRSTFQTSYVEPRRADARARTPAPTLRCELAGESMSSGGLQSTGGCAPAGSVTTGGFCSPARPRPLLSMVLELASQHPGFLSAPIRALMVRVTGAWLASQAAGCSGKELWCGDRERPSASLRMTSPLRPPTSALVSKGLTGVAMMRRTGWTRKVQNWYGAAPLPKHRGWRGPGPVRSSVV